MPWLPQDRVLSKLAEPRHNSRPSDIVWSTGGMQGGLRAEDFPAKGLFPHHSRSAPALWRRKGLLGGAWRLTGFNPLTDFSWEWDSWHCAIHSQPCSNGICSAGKQGKRHQPSPVCPIKDGVPRACAGDHQAPAALDEGMGIGQTPGINGSRKRLGAGICVLPKVQGALIPWVKHHPACAQHL